MPPYVPGVCLNYPGWDTADTELDEAFSSLPGDGWEPPRVCQRLFLVEPGVGQNTRQLGVICQDLRLLCSSTTGSVLSSVCEVEKLASHWQSPSILFDLWWQSAKCYTLAKPISVVRPLVAKC